MNGGPTVKMSKGERRAAARRKEQHGMRVTGKYFWIAIENSRVKRGEQSAPTAPQAADKHE